MGRLKGPKGVTLVASDTRVIGDIQFSDQLFINGCVHGNISGGAGDSATLVISEEGSVNGEIRVPNVVIDGRVEGNVFAAERVELGSRARVKGNVYYQLIEMQLGAMVDGQLLHEDLAASASVHPLHGDSDHAPEPALRAESM